MPHLHRDALQALCTSFQTHASLVLHEVGLLSSAHGHLPACVACVPRGYKKAMRGVRTLLLQSTAPEGGLLYVAELHSKSPWAKMDHLVCFLPGARLTTHPRGPGGGDRACSHVESRGVPCCEASAGGETGVLNLRGWEGETSSIEPACTITLLISGSQKSSAFHPFAISSSTRTVMFLADIKSEAWQG